MEFDFPFDTERPTRAEIRLGALRRNFAKAKALAGKGVKVMAAVKANAYGHGILRVSRELLDSGVDYLGVAFLEEGLFLRKNGVSAPVLVLGAVNAAQIPLFIENELALTVPSVEKAQLVSACAVSLGKTARVHLKIDTGMERIGVHWYSAEAFLDQVLPLPGLEIEGVFSHFAAADDDLAFSREQLSRFQDILASLDRRGCRPPLVHMANSAALVNLPESRFTMVRPGIMLYGYEPTPLSRTGVEPVMRLVSKVLYFKVVREGAGVSYGRTWIAETDTRLATIPAGYGDGYPRALSNRGRVVIRGKSHRIAGRICMDQFMVDLGKDGEAYNGDTVLLFGENGRDSVPVEEICSLLDTIPYEITCMIGARVPRVYVED